MWKKQNSVLLILVIILILTINFSISFTNGELINYTNFADYFASIILYLAIIISFLIYLSNSYPFFNKYLGAWIKYFIKLIPEDIALGKKLKNYLTSIIKENKKIIILLPYPDDTNKEIIFLLLLGFLERLENNPDTKGFGLILPNKNMYPVDIIFVKANSDDIIYYFNERIEDNYDYIVITGMSEIYKNAIFAKKLLIRDKQEQIKIIGALSSISVDIDRVTNYDENIIRVFPPDYDEAKTAINFLMSRIKNNICHNNNCISKNQKSNIIVLHAKEYGKAVNARCEEFYKIEMRDIYKTTNTNLSTRELEESIKFYSFTYEEENFIYDFIEDDSFEKYIKLWEEEKSTNYFFFVGYQPNVSGMLDSINPQIDKIVNNCTFLFSTPVSLDQWREEVSKSLQNFPSLNNDNYYLSVNRYTMISKFINIEEIQRRHKNCILKKISKKNILEKVSFQELINEESKINFSELILNNRIALFKEDNYISNFAKLSINIAGEYIQSDNQSLLNCKQQVFEKEGINLKLLINGDSIDNFKILLMKIHE